MSTTTQPAPAPMNVAVPAVSAAQTPRDVVTAMVNDPGLRSAILGAFTGLLSGDKSLLGTKTFWAALLMPVATFLVSYFGLGLDGNTIAAVVGLMSAAAANMIGMRLITKTPVTGIVSPASGS